MIILSFVSLVMLCPPVALILKMLIDENAFIEMVLPFGVARS